MHVLKTGAINTPWASNVTGEHFGGIYTAHLGPAGNEPLDGYHIAFEQMGLTHVRSPAGTMAERDPMKYTLMNYGEIFETGEFGFSDAAALAQNTNSLLTVIIPTLRYARNSDGEYSNEMRSINIADDELSEGKEHLRNFLEHVYSNENNAPETLLLELGNEFNLQHIFAENPEKYAEISRAFLQVIADFEEDFGDKNIRVSVQTGDWTFTNLGDNSLNVNDNVANQLIMDTIQDSEYSYLVTDLSYHVLQGNLWEITGEERPGRPTKTEHFREMAEEWEEQFGREFNMFASAWNVTNLTLVDEDRYFEIVGEKTEEQIEYYVEYIERALSDTGFGSSLQVGAQAQLVVLELFSRMLESGIDTAALWGIEREGVRPNSWTNYFDEDGEKVSLYGPKAAAIELLATALIPPENAVESNQFRLMQDLSGIGTNQTSDPLEAPYHIYGFENDDTLVLYFAAGSLSDGQTSFDFELEDFQGLQIETVRRTWTEANDAYVNPNGGRMGISADIWKLVDDKLEAKLYSSAEVEVVEAHEDVVVTNGGQFSIEFEQPHQVVEVTVKRFDAFEGMHFIGSTIDDEVIGTDNNDIIYSNAGNDKIYTAEGNDLIFGGAGEDELLGGLGDDQIRGEDGNDFLNGQRGNDILSSGAGSDVVQGGDGDDEIALGDGDDTGRGGQMNDKLFGDAGDDLLIGGQGFDELWGGVGDDILSGNDGSDELWGEDGNDHLNGGKFNDKLVGGKGDDFLVGGSGDDDIWGNDGNDTIYGSSGIDKVSAGNGDDIVFLGFGADTAYGGSGNDKIHGKSGADRILSGDGHDLVRGGSGEDVIFAGAGDDRVIGGSENDTVDGGDGDDILSGNSGDDTLIGGSGADVFVFKMVDTQSDIIIDFNVIEDAVHVINSGVSVDDLFTESRSIDGNDILVVSFAESEIIFEGLDIENYSEISFLFG